MVRVLHTADWHLGHTLAGYSREAEHRAALDALVEIAAREAVDAVVVAGDVFDALNPSAEAQALFFDTLTRLHAARPHAAIVVVAGNHDPAGRLEAPRGLYAFANVTVVGTIERGRAGGPDLARHLVPVRDETGATRAHVLAVPFPRVADLPPLDAPGEGSPVVAGVRALYADLVGRAAEAIGPESPLVVTGHLHVAGGLESDGAERRILVGGEHAVPPDVFPARAGYVALGHLHRPQAVGRESVRYSGSLFPLSKTESGYEHGVTLVDLESASAPVRLRHVPLPRPVPCLRLPARGAVAAGDVEGTLAALGLDADLPVSRRPFVWLTVAVDGPAVGLHAEIGEIAERFPVRLAGLTLERPGSEAAPTAAPVGVRLAEREPIDVFREAFGAKHGVPPSRAHDNAFAALLTMDEAEG
ncbi:exonuclease SbcCD subunit D [Salinarimonas ramus]|uniref:Nuclease SbcCD subunit D n=1 Tax=Salinarimonas ramus TaxID=690164 RepID=A0A917Q614_9HYPH|nr:exonuclease SbcCD subunit D [Salinarimonas ramus]GGK28825.1 nuclease SbcCD subunit D [Salinarimonas ramus]